MREQNNLDNKSEYDFANQKIAFLAGRPDRNKTISDGDIANLKIALNTAKSLDDFFRTV